LAARALRQAGAILKIGLGTSEPTFDLPRRIAN